MSMLVQDASRADKASLLPLEASNSVFRTAGVAWLTISAFFEHHPSEVCHDVSHHHGLLVGRSQQDQISEHFRNPGGDLHQVSLLILQVALQHFVNVTMQTVRHPNSFGSGEALRHLLGRA